MQNREFIDRLATANLYIKQGDRYCLSDFVYGAAPAPTTWQLSPHL